MVHDHSYVIGGNNNYEYCGAAGKLNDQLSDATCETCNTYNMLKLTKHLFEWQPTAELGDYYERALYNHILASQNPDDGMMCYFCSVAYGNKKAVQRFIQHFYLLCWKRYGKSQQICRESIYFEDKDGNLYVNLLSRQNSIGEPSNTVLHKQPHFPSDNTTIKLRTANTKQFTVFIRQPHWAKQGITVLVNGMPLRRKPTTMAFLRSTAHGKTMMKLT